MDSTQRYKLLASFRRTQRYLEIESEAIALNSRLGSLCSLSVSLFFWPSRSLINSIRIMIYLITVRKRNRQHGSSNTGIVCQGLRAIEILGALLPGNLGEAFTGDLKEKCRKLSKSGHSKWSIMLVIVVNAIVALWALFKMRFTDFLGAFKKRTGN